MMLNALSKNWTQGFSQASSLPRRGVYSSFLPMEVEMDIDEPIADDESDKGMYEPVGPRLVQRQEKRTSGILYMTFLLICGLGLMLAHHFFYAYLNDKSIDPGSTELPSRLKNQDDVPVTTHGKEGVQQGPVEVRTLVVRQTRSTVNVLWQDGTKERLDSRETVPYLNPDEYDCW